MLNSPIWPAASSNVRPQYLELVKYLIEPLLDNPAAMRIDCEQVNQNRRIWIRLAFDDADKGRVFGRGGRNLQAVRTVLGLASATVGQSVYLDIHNEEEMDSQLGGLSASRNKFVKKPERRRYRTRTSPPYPNYGNEDTF